MEIVKWCIGGALVALALILIYEAFAPGLQPESIRALELQAATGQHAIDRLGAIAEKQAESSSESISGWLGLGLIIGAVALVFVCVSEHNSAVRVAEIKLEAARIAAGSKRDSIRIEASGPERVPEISNVWEWRA